MGKDIDNSKTEERAIGVLYNIINDHPTMESKINKGEKGMSWDGSITIYKPGCTKRTKETYDYDIPVQIKGRTDRVTSYLDKKTITYPVDIRDLKLYYEQTGCLYFIIFFDETAKRGEVFYASLYPSKLKSFLEKQDNKRKKQISIRFTHLNKDAGELYCVLAQYGKEMIRQGSGRGQIVPKTIRLNDIASVNAISATVVGAKNEMEFIERMNSGDVCIYGNVNGIDFPIESDESVKFFMGRDNVQLPIMVEERKYYDKYNVVYNPDTGIVVRPSDNIVIQLNKGKIDFRPKSDIPQIKNDIDFLLALEKSHKLHFGNSEIPFGDIVFPEEFKDKLSYLKALCDVVAEVGIEIHKTFAQLSESNSRELCLLVNIKEGNLNDKFKQTSNIFNWSFDDKFYPLLIEKQPQGNVLFPLSKNSSMQVLKWDGKTNHYKFPTFAVVDTNVLAKLYNYDYTWFEKQIDMADVNPDTIDDLNIAALKLISAYDLSANMEFLNLAKRIYSKCESKDVCYLINTLQIKVREKGLNASDIKKLNTIKTNDAQTLFCKSVLLGNKKDAEDYYSGMSKEEKENIKALPIMKLYSDL